MLLLLSLACVHHPPAPVAGEPGPDAALAACAASAQPSCPADPQFASVYVCDDAGAAAVRACLSGQGLQPSFVAHGEVRCGEGDDCVSRTTTYLFVGALPPATRDGLAARHGGGTPVPVVR